MKASVIPCPLTPILHTLNFGVLRRNFLAPLTKLFFFRSCANRDAMRLDGNGQQDIPRLEGLHTT